MKIIIYLFLIATFFPYLRFFNIGTNSDIQVYSFIFSSIIILYQLFKYRTINKKIFCFQLYVFVITIILFIIFRISGEGNLSLFIRGVYGYISLGMIVLSSYITMKKIEEKKLEKAIKVFYFIWTSVGIIQLINRNFLTGWRIRKVITSDRGVISLSSEPAYFCLALILMTLILLNINYIKNKKYMYITLFASIFLSMNAVGIIYSSILILLYSTSKRFGIRSIISVFIIGLTIICVYNYIIYFKSDTRLGFIMNNLFENSRNILLLDVSLNIRFAHLFLTVKAFLKDLFIPHGVTNWTEYYISEVISQPDLFIEPIARLQNSNGRIVTIHGRLIYELGVLAFPIYYYVFKVVKIIPQGNIIASFIFILGLNGLNISDPMFGFLLGYIIYKGVTLINDEKKVVFM